MYRSSYQITEPCQVIENFIYTCIFKFNLKNCQLITKYFQGMPIVRSFCFVYCCFVAYPNYAILWHLNCIFHLFGLCIELYVFFYFYNPHMYFFSLKWLAFIIKKTRKNCFRYLKLMSPLNAAICTTISYTL